MGHLRRVLIVVAIALVAAACDNQPRAASHAVLPTPPSTVTAVAASRSPSTPPAVVSAARAAAAWDGDPSPHAPVQWVRTTDHAAASITGGETPSDDPIYMVQIQGHFPSCPPCTGLLPQGPGTVIVLTVPVDGSVPGSGFSFGNRVHNLSTLGTVHTFRL